MSYQDPPAGTTTKRKAAIGVGALLALLTSCGIGTAMGGDQPTKAASPTTVTSIQTKTETTTETVTQTPSRAATTTTTDESTVEDTPETTVDEPDTTARRPVPLVPQTTREAPSAYYSNCAQARAAGAAPMYQGSPGYRSALDRDGDGVACDKG